MSKYSYIVKLNNIITLQPNLMLKYVCDMKIAMAEQKLYQCYVKRSDTKDPSRVEQIDTIKMPGFVDPQNIHDEGHFAQKAKQQLEELKKRQDKPVIDNTEKKE